MSTAHHTAGPWGVHFIKVLSKPVAAMELSRLIEGTKGFSGVLPMVVAANGLCVAVTGCGPDGLLNARSIAAAVNACAGVPVEVLEANAAGGLPWSVADQIDQRVLVRQMLDALVGVVQVADRSTVEFDAARAAIAAGMKGAAA